MMIHEAAFTLRGHYQQTAFGSARPVETFPRTAREQSTSSLERLGLSPTRAPADARQISRRSQFGHFLRHYGEMCAPMCIGFAVGDLVYFWAVGLFGYSTPFSELPELSVLVVTFTMTAPMTAWMVYRGMPRRATAEMSAAMPVLAVVLLAFGWLALLPKSDLAWLEHGLMMPVMLIPMFARLDLYTGRVGHSDAHTARGSAGSGPGDRPAALGQR
jgi:hypothetical protein